MAITLLRAIRLPNDFAEAHWLIDYRFGFIKRGLVGAVFTTLSEVAQFPQTAWSIAVSSLTVLALFTVVLMFVSSRIIATSNWDGDVLLMANVFLTSPFLVMSAHLTGYYDPIFISLAFISILLIKYDHPWFAAVLQGVAILVHESSMLVGLPCVALACVLKARCRPREQAPRIFAPLLVPIVVFAALAVYQSIIMDRAHVEFMLARRLSSFDFLAFRRDNLVPHALVMNFADSLRSEFPFFLRRLTSHKPIFAVGPAVITVLYFLYKTFKIPLVSIESSLIAIAALAPLLLHAIAWDTTRIWTYTVVCAFCVTWVYVELGVKPAGIVQRSYFFLLAVPALLMNVFGKIPLMDKQVERFTDPERLLLYAPVLIGALSTVFPHSLLGRKNLNAENDIRSDAKQM